LDLSYGNADTKGGSDMFGGLGFGEILLIFLVVLLLFGAKRLPEIGKAMGQAWHEFSSAMKGEGKNDDSKNA